MTTMKTETDAFVDTPPAGYLPLSQKTLLLINRAVARAGLTLDTVEMVGAYRAISYGNSLPTADEIDVAFIDMTDAEVDAVTAYVTRVMARREEAEVQVESTPGK
jgi:hypothetical protein